MFNPVLLDVAAKTGRYLLSCGVLVFLVVAEVQAQSLVLQCKGSGTIDVDGKVTRQEESIFVRVDLATGRGAAEGLIFMGEMAQGSGSRGWSQEFSVDDRQISLNRVYSGRITGTASVVINRYTSEMTISEVNIPIAQGFTWAMLMRRATLRCEPITERRF